MSKRITQSDVYAIAQAVEVVRRIRANTVLDVLADDADEAIAAMERMRDRASGIVNHDVADAINAIGAEPTP